MLGKHKHAAHTHTHGTFHGTLHATLHATLHGTLRHMHMHCLSHTARMPRLVVLAEVEAGQLVSQRGHECRVGAERCALLREDARPCGRSEYGSELSTRK